MARRRQISHRVHYARLSRRRKNFHTMQIYIAASDRNARKVKSLIKQGVRINARDSNGRSLLHVNAINGYSDITGLLIKAGCKINSINGIGDTPLHEAISHGNVAVAMKLIRHGANIRAKNCEEGTPLHFAVTNLSHVELAKEIVHRGVRINSVNVHGMSALTLAVKAKNVKMVRFLISKGVDINSKLCSTSALHITAIDNSFILAIMLLNAGAEVNRRDVNGCTPIQYAIYAGNIEMVKNFLKAGASIDIQNKIGATALHIAIVFNREAISLLLLSSGASVNVKAQGGATPLHWAAMLNIRSSHLTILKRLLECGGDANKPNEGGQTPFHFIIQNGDISAVRLFLDYKADVQKMDRNGGTALHYAVYNVDREVLKLVIKCGVEINQPCNSGITPLHDACKQLNPDYIIQLIGRGANVNARDNFGRTPLYFSVTQPYRIYQLDRPKIAEDRRVSLMLLLEAGSDLNLWFHVQNRTMSILDVALQRRDFTASKMIVERAAKIEAWTNTPFFDEKYLAAIDPKIKTHFEMCQAELAAMRRTKIKGTLITYLNVLLKPDSVVARYARNTELVREFETSSYREAYPIYKAQLKVKFNVGYILQRRMEKVARILSTTLQFADPSDVCFEIIFKYLSKKEVDTLIDAAFCEEQNWINNCNNNR